MLLEEIEADIDFVNQQGSKAFEASDYDSARDALEKAGQITAYREKARCPTARMDTNRV